MIFDAFELENFGVMVIQKNYFLYANATFYVFYKKKFLTELPAPPFEFQRLEYQHFQNINIFLNQKKITLHGLSYQIKAQKRKFNNEEFTIISVLDITAQQRQAMRLHELEQSFKFDQSKIRRYKRIINETPNPCLIVSLDKTSKHRTYINNAFRDVLGYAPHEIEIKTKANTLPLIMMVFAEDRLNFINVLRHGLEGIVQKSPIEIRVKTKKKGFVWMQCTIKVIRNTINEVVIFLNDVSCLKNQAEELKEKTNLLAIQNAQKKKAYKKALQIAYYAGIVSFFLYSLGNMLIKNEQLYALNSALHRQHHYKIKQLEKQYYLRHKYYNRVLGLQKQAYRDSIYNLEIKKLTSEIDSANHFFEMHEPNGAVWQAQKLIFGTGFFKIDSATYQNLIRF